MAVITTLEGMPLPLSALSLVALAICNSYILWSWFIYPIFFSPLSRIPAAHPLAAFTGAWIWWKRFRENDSMTVHEAHKAKGDFVRLSPFEVSVNCVDGGAKKVYGYDKHVWYTVFENYGVTTMFGSLSRKPHIKIRKQVGMLYTKRSMLGEHLPVSNAIFQEVVHNRWVPMIQAAITAGKPVDVYEMDLAVTMDLTTCVVYGIPSSSNHILNVDERGNWNHHYKYLKSCMFWQQEMYSTIDLFNQWGIPFPFLTKRYFQSIDGVEADGMRLAERVFARDASGKRERNEGLLYQQLQDKTDAYPAEKTATHELKLASEMLDHCFAGHGTASITLTFAFYHLSIKPVYQERIRAELARLGAQPDIAAIDKKCPLLESVILETLRLYPSPPASQPRVAPEGGCQLGPYGNIPAGTRVSAQAYSLHRNEDVFPDSERWWPERWLPHYGNAAGVTDGKTTPDGWDPADTQRIRELHRWFLSFGAGDRACPGKDYGMLGIKAVLAGTYGKFSSRKEGWDDMRQMDGNSEGQPRSQRCLIRFESVSEEKGEN